MTKFSLLFLILFPFLFFKGGDCYSQVKVDSLKSELEMATGRNKLDLLYDISTEYLYNSFLLSEKYARFGLREAINQNDTLYQMKFYRKIGGVKQYASQYDSAVFYHQKAADLAKIAEDEYQQALARLNMANIFTYTEEYDKAIEVFSASLSALVEQNDTNALALTYNNLGTAFMSVDKLDSAEFYLQKSIALKIYLGKRVSLGISLSNIGDVYLLLDEYQRAEDNFKNALAIFEQEESIYNISYACIRLSELYIELGKNELSELYLHRALELSEEVGSIKLKADAYKMLSELFENTGQFDKALDYQKKFMILNDSIAENKYSGLLNEMNIVFQLAEQEKELEILNKDILLKESKITLLRSLIIVFIVLVLLILVFYLRIRKKDKILFKQSLKDLKGSKDKNLDQIDEKVEELYGEMILLFEEKKIYLDATLTIGKLSEMLNSNNNYVSKCINLKFADNFNSVLNMYRVKEAKILIRAEKYNNYTIAAISEMCGFTSLSVFNRSFKKETGITPSYFMKSLK
jgi:AraC-like DNA-binding protein